MYFHNEFNSHKIIALLFAVKQKSPFLLDILYKSSSKAKGLKAAGIRGVFGLLKERAVDDFQ